MKRDVSPRKCDENPTAVYLGRAIIIITYPYGDFKHYRPHGLQALRKHTDAIYGDFYSCKNDIFQLKKKIFDIFLIFAQNIDRGYTIEPPQ